MHEARGERAQAAALIFLALLFAGGLFLLRHRRLAVSAAELRRTEAVYALKIDPNTADWQELALLPGIGEKKAKEIVLYREANGPFKDAGALSEVAGIGEKTVAEMAPFITFEGTYE